MSPAAQSLVLPRAFGRYVLFDLIGRGGMAEIYLARQKIELGGGRLCVVKQNPSNARGRPKIQRNAGP